MPTIKASGLGFAYGDHAPIFERVTFHLSEGFYGVVGANGAGKTTLARLLTRELAPSVGSLSFEPDPLRVALCEQRVDALTPDLLEFARDEGRSARRLRSRFELSVEELERWPSLSPGERKRWQLAAALASEPDVLILDEPTNHLDRSARDRAIGALERFRGTGLVVSHDCELLERLTTRTLRVHAGSVELFPGHYFEARALWEAEKHRAQRDRAALVSARDELEGRLDRARREQAAAHRQVSTGARLRNLYDSDARGIGARNLGNWAEAGIGRKARHLRHELELTRAKNP